jgi:replicative DNA helicase
MPNESARPRPFDAAAWLARLDTNGPTNDTVPTGFPSVDVKLGGGPRRGDLVVLCGDAGVGKSALAMALALRAAAAGHEVALFSGEADTARLIERALGMLSKTPIDALRRGDLDEETHARVAAAVLRLRDHSPLFSFVPPNGVGGLSDLLIDLLGIGLVVIDPIEALATGRGPRDEEMAHIARELKAMAVRRQCTVVVTTPLARPVRERPDPRPQLEDLGAHGAFAQHADLVLGLFREEQYHAAADIEGAAELHLLKHRTGSLGWVDLYLYKRWLRFEDMVEG